ncbi:MAG: adenylate kinase family protein [Desulfurococcaceae archaeon TW002]
MGKAIVISGTPGVGKTLVATMLASRLGLNYLNLSDLVVRESLYVGVDEIRGSFVIDEERLVKRLTELLSRSESDVVVDSHYGEIIPEELVRIIFVLRLNPAILYERLVSRGWGEEKVKENVEAEILGVCTYNALSEHSASKVCEVDVTGKEVEKVVKELLDILNNVKKCEVWVDWLSQELPQDFITKLLGTSTNS